MGRNLKYQFLNAINNNFKEGMDKHSLKSNNMMNNTRIFSYKDRENLKDVSANFSNYMKENYNDIKLVKDIKAEHIQSFLNNKAETCSQKTIEQYASKFNKLENIVNSTYSINANFKGFLIPGAKENTKIRDVAMTKVDFKKLENEFSNSKSSAKEAIQLTSKLGLRVSETVKLQSRDINLDKETVHIEKSKGGRDRDIQIRQEDKQYFSDLKERYGEYERICPVKEESINKAIRRAMEKLDIADNYKDTNIHAIRKMYAQEQYDRYRKNGLEINEALGKVSEALGHSENRLGLMKEYVLDIK